MNKTFFTIWNATLGAWVAVSELARARSKSSGSGAVLVASVLLGTSPAYAVGPTVLPTGGQVSAGQAQITTGAGNAMTVTQASARTAINWNTFSIGKDGTVNFVQPNASAIALNRVTGREGSVIDGALTANGQVFILNPNGVLFGQGARVDTAGLVATTLGLSDADFMAGKTRFSSLGGATGAVINRGTLNAKDGGYIALLGTQVKNDGVITARLGTVALAAGNKVSLNFNGDSLVGVVVDEGALDALVANGGAVRADGGLVVLTAKGAEGLVNTLVNNTGEVRAQTVENRAGKIYLLGENGAVEVAGALDASALGTGNGGFIETSAPVLKVHDGARVTTAAAAGNSGTWLIDPTDFTIGAGSGAQTSSGMGATTLQTALGAGNVTIQTAAAGTEAGDITVSAPVAWSANTTLTLSAFRNIYIDETISSSGSTGKLALEYGQGALASANTANYFIAPTKTVDLSAGANFSTKLGSNGAVSGYTVLTDLGAAGSITATDLQGMNGARGGYYVLGANIDATATASWSGGFDPVGRVLGAPINGNPQFFAGKFDGLGHTITSLTINRGGSLNTGLFGFAFPSTPIRNLGFITPSITGGSYIGTLAGELRGAGAYNVWVTGGSVAGSSFVGGLVGSMSALVSDIRTSASVLASGGGAGGLSGYMVNGTIQRSAATGQVSGQDAGGMVGQIYGQNSGGTYIVDSYATGSVNGVSAGGLIAVVVGGTVGIRNSYSTGAVTGSNQRGGLVGNGNINAINSYWDTQTSGQATSRAGTGRTTAQMQDIALYAGANPAWAMAGDLSLAVNYPALRVTRDGSSVWVMTYPVLTAITLTVNNTSREYGSANPTLTSGGWAVAGCGGCLSSVAFGAGFTPTLGVGTYDYSTVANSLGLSYRYGSASNYTVTVANGALSITPRSVGSTTMTNANRAYDGTTNVAQSMLQIDASRIVNGDVVMLTGVGQLASANAGNQTVFALGSLALNNANYQLTGLPAGTVAITPLVLNASTVVNASRAYDRTTDADAVLLTLDTTSVLNGDTVSLTGVGSLSSADAGSRTVTGLGSLSLTNANYQLTTLPTGTVVIAPRMVSLATAGSATRVYDGTINAASSLLQVTGILSGDAVNLGGSATLASKNVGAQALTLGGLTLDNGNYTLTGVTPTGTVAILPRTLNLSFAVADKTFDGNTAASATASDNRVSGDQFTANFIAAFGDTNAGLVKPVTISGLALQGADAGNYQLASGSTTGVTGNMLARNLTYSLVAQDPTRTYTATGQVLVSAAALDQLVVASLANTIAGTSPGALSYTLWRNGQQVTDITQAGTYEIRANFATPDAHYALATTGNSTLTLTVSAATPGTPPTKLPAATLASAFPNTIAEAVRTDVPSTAAMLASAGVSAARPLAEFAPMAANVASPIPGLSATFGEGAPLSLISSPDARETSTSVTLEQARRMLKVASTGNGGSADAGSREVRVPVSRNSLAEIVNGGVKLPSGVDQLLFVVKAGQ